MGGSYNCDIRDPTLSLVVWSRYEAGLHININICVRMRTGRMEGESQLDQTSTWVYPACDVKSQYVGGRVLQGFVEVIQVCMLTGARERRPVLRWSHLNWMSCKHGEGWDKRVRITRPGLAISCGKWWGARPGKQELRVGKLVSRKWGYLSQSHHGLVSMVTTLSMSDARSLWSCRLLKS